MMVQQAKQGIKPKFSINRLGLLTSTNIKMILNDIQNNKKKISLMLITVAEL